VRETLADGRLGPLRQFGFAKIAVGSTVRNATQAEIDGFAGLEATDEAAMDAADAATEIQTHPRQRKVFKALVKRIIAENNLQATWVNDFAAQVAAASNLADLKSRVSSLGTLPTRTLQQALTALLNDISPND
jgi:hypothetical protein